jgi:hypothetical protein
MVKKNEDNDLKEKALLNYAARPHETKVKFSEWCNAQHNLQNSFLSLVEHMIDRFGYVDVCDHDIAKKLHTEILYFNGVTREEKPLDNLIETNKISNEPVPVVLNDVKNEPKLVKINTKEEQSSVVKPDKY